MENNMVIFEYDKDDPENLEEIVEICKPEMYADTKRDLSDLVQSGRLPITEQNIEIIIEEPDMSEKKMINEKSSMAALTMIGLQREGLKHSWENILNGYDDLGTVLFVTSHNQKDIT